MLKDGRIAAARFLQGVGEYSRVGIVQRGGDVARQPEDDAIIRREQCGIGDDLHLTHVRSLDIDAPDPGNARDQRLDVVAGEVV